MKKVTLLAVCAAALFVFASCGSKPAATDTTPEAPAEETTVEQTEASEEDSTVADKEALLAKIEEARKLALEAGAETKAADLLKAIDALYEKVQNDEGDISLSAADLIARYNALANYIQAKEEKQKIDDNDFASYDQKDYDEGSTLLASVEEAYSNEKWDASVAADALAAYGKFKNVTQAAYKKLALEERGLAFEAKRKADGVKAGVAKKEQYKETVKLFQTGDQLYSIQAPEKAYENYKTSKEQFTALYDEVAEKRAAAQARLEEAKKAVEESAAFAEEADVSAPITEPVEGIEDESAVLLEEDNYADSSESEIDVPEFIDDQNAENADEPALEAAETAVQGE